jgi:hypothetical protein
LASGLGAVFHHEDGHPGPTLPKSRGIENGVTDLLAQRNDSSGMAETLSRHVVLLAIFALAVAILPALGCKRTECECQGTYGGVDLVVEPYDGGSLGRVSVSFVGEAVTDHMGCLAGSYAFCLWGDGDTGYDDDPQDAGIYPGLLEIEAQVDGADESIEVPAAIAVTISPPSDCCGGLPYAELTPRTVTLHPDGGWE